MTEIVFGYVRVSTLAQVNDRQIDALVAAGVKSDNIYSDKITGMKYDRPGMNEMIGKDGKPGKAREGDTIIVAEFSRLGRNMVESILTANRLQDAGINLLALKENIDYSTASGRMIAGVFASLAQFEREQMLERAAEARQAAKDRGMTGGRPSRLTEDQRRQVRALHAAGESADQLVKTFDVSRRTIYRALGEAQKAA